MSKKIYLFSLVLLALAFTACSETEETSRYDNWQARSVAFIDSIASVYDSPKNQALDDDDPEKLHAFPDPTNSQTIYVKKIKKGEGTGMTGLAGEVIYEAVKFIIMLLLLAGGVVIGGKLRTRSDAKKEAKNKEI